MTKTGEKQKKIKKTINTKEKRYSLTESSAKKTVKKSVPKQLTGQRKTIQAHLSARNRRSQVKRDSR